MIDVEAVRVVGRDWRINLRHPHVLGDEGLQQCKSLGWTGLSGHACIVQWSTHPAISFRVELSTDQRHLAPPSLSLPINWSLDAFGDDLQPCDDDAAISDLGDFGKVQNWKEGSSVSCMQFCPIAVVPIGTILPSGQHKVPSCWITNPGCSGSVLSDFVDSA